MIKLLLPALALSCAAASQQAGTLRIASGTIESRVGSDGEFAPLAKGAAIQDGTWLRTGAGAYGVLELQGAELRIGENSEILVNDRRAIEIKQGRIFPKMSRGGEFSIKTEFTTMRMDTVEMDVIFKPRVPNSDPAKLSLIVFAGVAAVPARGYVHPQKMTAGFVCDMIGAQLNTPDRFQPGVMMATKWIHPILAEQGIATKEVESRCNELHVSLLKASKDEDRQAIEKEFKVLGKVAVPSLMTKLKQSSGGNAIDPARLIVARLVIDGATNLQGNDLLGLLKDNDPEIRVIAAKTLTRLANGNDQSYKEAYWRANNLEAGQKAWETWVRKN